MNKKDIEKIVELILQNKEANVKDLVNTQPEKTMDKIPEIIKSMNPTELKKQFGTNIFQYKFVGIKDFMQRNNIVSGSKYPPNLNYENKHLIIERVIKSLPKKQQETKVKECIRTLKEKINNPPKTLYGNKPTEKQIQHINANLQQEINRFK